MGSSVVLLGDQFPMPSQQGLRRDYGSDLGKNLRPNALAFMANLAAEYH
jgi:hypothetical protein